MTAAWRERGAYWGVVALWMVVISTLSEEPFSARNTHHYIDPILRYFFPHLDANGILAAHWWVRKSAHFIEFFVLGWLSFWASRRGRAPRWRARWSLQAVAVGVGFALLDETHQVLVPERTGSIVDSAIDASGAIASQIVVVLYSKSRLWLTGANDRR